MHKSAFWVATVSAMAVIAPCGAIRAATNEIVVSASRDYSTSEKLPGNVSVITSRDIAAAGAASVVDAMRNLDGVEFRSSSGNASQAEVSMRGFGENSGGRVLVLLDGRELNSPEMSGINWLQIPVANVDRIEVMRGDQCALYGDHAVGGVINIVTKKGAAQPRTTAEVLGGSYGMNSERLGTVGTADGVAYSAYAQHDGTDGYRHRSGYEGWNGGGSLGWDANERIATTLSLGYNKLNYGLPGYLTREQMDQDPRQSVNPADRAAAAYWNADLDLAAQVGEADRGDVRVSYGRRDNRSDWVSLPAFSDTDLDSVGVLPSYVLDRHLFGHRNVLLLGVDYYRDMLSVERFGDEARATTTAAADVVKQTLGAYVREEFYATDRLTLAVGGRTEQATIEADVFDGAGAQVVDADKTHRANVVDGSVLYRPGAGSKLFARAGEVYRYPFVDEQVSYFGYGSDTLYANVEMEKGESYEVGAELTPLETVKIGCTLFLLNMRDEINFNGVTLRNENMDRDRRQGVEASLEVRPSRGCRLTAGYAYTDARFTAGDNDGKRLPLAPRHKVTLAGECALPLRLTATAAATYVSEQVLGGDYANADAPLDAYTTVDVGLRYAATRDGALELFAAVENLFDEPYAGVGYKGFATDGYYPSPGRTFKGGVRCTF